MLLAAHLPVMLIEGIVTAVAVSFIARVRPALLPETTRLKLAGMIPPAE
jgi:cobalt/nickel transport system permease protein